MIRIDLSRALRIGSGILTAAMLVGSYPVEAAAARHRYRKHVVRDHTVRQPARNAEASAVPQAIGPGPMRYYGGPKSPMWR